VGLSPPKEEGRPQFLRKSVLVSQEKRGTWGESLEEKHLKPTYWFVGRGGTKRRKLMGSNGRLTVRNLRTKGSNVLFTRRVEGGSLLTA